MIYTLNKYLFLSIKIIYLFASCSISKDVVESVDVNKQSTLQEENSNVLPQYVIDVATKDMKDMGNGMYEANGYYYWFTRLEFSSKIVQTYLPDAIFFSSNSQTTNGVAQSQAVYINGKTMSPTGDYNRLLIEHKRSNLNLKKKVALLLALGKNDEYTVVLKRIRKSKEEHNNEQYTVSAIVDGTPLELIVEVRENQIIGVSRIEQGRLYSVVFPRYFYGH